MNQAQLMSPPAANSVVAPVLTPQSFFPRPTDEQVKRCSIMIIDDEEAVVLSVKKHLQLAGFQKFHLVTDATHAISQIREKQPDLVLLDVRMQVNGLTILTKLRDDDQLPNTPIIMLAETMRDQQRALDQGVQFLPKPYDASAIVSALQSSLATIG